MTPDQLAEIEARAKAATEGPWEVSWPPYIGTKDGRVNVRTRGGLSIGYAHAFKNRPESNANAVLWAAARQDIPDLIAYIRELEANGKLLRDHIAELEEDVHALAYDANKWRDSQIEREAAEREYSKLKQGRGV